MLEQLSSLILKLSSAKVVLQSENSSLLKLKEDIKTRDIFIAVLGSNNSGKTGMISKECYEDENILASGDSSIIRVKKVYGSTPVEYWLSPEQPALIPEMARYLSSFAGSIFFFDVAYRSSFDAVSVWLQEMDKQSERNAFGFVKVLIATGCGYIERQVDSDEGDSLATRNNMYYYETRFHELKKHYWRSRNIARCVFKDG